MDSEEKDFQEGFREGQPLTQPLGRAELIDPEQGGHVDDDDYDPPDDGYELQRRQAAHHQHQQHALAMQRLGELGDEFPEWSEAVLAHGNATAGALRQEVADASNRARAEAVLDMQIPGWDKEAQTQVFEDWVNADQERTRLSASDKADDAIELMQQWRRHRGGPGPRRIKIRNTDDGDEDGFRSGFRNG